MTKNIIKSDRIVRFIVAAILIGLYLTDILTGTVGNVALTIAIVMVVTAVFSYCPMYTVLAKFMPHCKGKNSCCSTNHSDKKDDCCGGGHCHTKDKE